MLCLTVLLASACSEQRVTTAVVTPVPNEAPATPAAIAPAGSVPAASETAFCERTCAFSRDLHCTASASCAEVCRDSMREMPCKELFASVVSCAAAQPIGQWECSEEGLAAIKDGPCDTQQSAFLSCLESATP